MTSTLIQTAGRTGKRFAAWSRRGGGRRRKVAAASSGGLRLLNLPSSAHKAPSSTRTDEAAFRLCSRRANRPVRSRGPARLSLSHGPTRLRSSARLLPSVERRTPQRLRHPPDDGQEMDLTEQMYGSDLAGFGGERDSSDDEDLASRNRLHDTEAWTSAPSGSPSTLLAPNRQAAALMATPIPSRAGHRPMKEFSLDEYAQRMRTAAIMLSQLNKSTNASKARRSSTTDPTSAPMRRGLEFVDRPHQLVRFLGVITCQRRRGGGDKSEVGQAQRASRRISRRASIRRASWRACLWAVVVVPAAHVWCTLRRKRSANASWER